MADSTKGAHFASGSDEKTASRPAHAAHAATPGQGKAKAPQAIPTRQAAGRAQANATPMVQSAISSRTAQATQRAGQQAGRHTRRRRGGGQRHVPVIAFVVVALAVLGAFGYWVTHHEFSTPDNGPTIQSGLEVTLSIPEGAGAAEISEILREEGVITSASDFFKELRNQEAESSLKSGTYSLLTGMSVKDVVRQLVEGPNSMADVLTVPEGYTVAQVARIVEERLEIPADDFLARAKASNYVADYPFLAEAYDDSLEGFLFPKTYDLGGKDKTADTVIRLMLSQYQEEVASLDFDAAAARMAERYDISMTPYEFLTMASVIEKEAFSGDDWVNVSSTFYNRLSVSMPLQSDATMGYVTGGEVTPDDLEEESPYNTYLNYGLPPSPICNPGMDSIQAALNPADTDYYYFLIVENGDYSYHAFSENYDQHLEAIEKALAEQAE